MSYTVWVYYSGGRSECHTVISDGVKAAKADLWDCLVRWGMADDVEYMEADDE